ncbi:MAG: patatin, partial [candidate division Zixibacteria bacterium]|nr:patatin [candidate division Zixibacteria bacterium]
PIPEEIGGSGDIYGIVDVRWWSDEAPPMIEEWMKLSPSVLKNKYSDLFGKVHNYLAISGGGADGAFGAGLLVGWTE